MGLFIVRQYERLVVFRLGQFKGVKQPGIRWLWPILEQGSKVDLREFFSEIPRQTTITKDNAPIDIDFLVYMRVLDDRPEDTVLKIQNFQASAQGLAMTTLRAVIGDISLDEVLSKRDQINLVLRSKLDDATEGWGVRVTRVEIREIDPPRDIQDAMNRQMAAERDRRATVTSAEGERQAQITLAEGARQAAILRAEGERQATILEAEGRRQASILNAEGFSIALERINTVAATADVRTMSLQYFETLKELGNGESTKFIFPMEFTSMLQPLLSGFGLGAPGNGGGGADVDQQSGSRGSSG